MGLAADHEQQRAHDLFLQSAGLWMWCLPGCAAIGAAVLASTHRLSMTGAEVVWTLATLWIGVGCAWNARRCGRVHCVIDGILFPVLGAVGLLNILGVLPMSWNLYWAAFGAILVAGFVPEVIGKRYYI